MATAAQATMLVVDDDVVFAEVLSRAMQKRGYTVTIAHSAEHAMRSAEGLLPAYAILDLKMAGDSGLTLIQKLKSLNPAITIVMLTGYASIATAVEAIKLGATHYLAKPANAEEICRALKKNMGDASVPVAETPPSVDRLEWEHIQRVLKEHEGNVSATARTLNMHRRTLQRKLLKYPTKR